MLKPKIFCNEKQPQLLDLKYLVNLNVRVPYLSMFLFFKRQDWQK